MENFLTFLYKGAIFSLIFQLFFGAWPEFSGWPEFRPKIRAGPTACWPAGQAFYQPESPRAGKFPARPNPTPAMPAHIGAESLKTPHHIITLSFR